MVCGKLPCSLWLDTVEQFSPTARYVDGCLHAPNVLAPRIQGETKPEGCSPDVLAATTFANSRLRKRLFGEGGSRFPLQR